MQQLYFVKKEKLEWREVPTLTLDNKKEAIVRPFAVAKCDLDDAFLFNNQWYQRIEFPRHEITPILQSEKHLRLHLALHVGHCPNH